MPGTLSKLKVINKLKAIESARSYIYTYMLVQIHAISDCSGLNDKIQGLAAIVPGC